MSITCFPAPSAAARGFLVAVPWQHRSLLWPGLSDCEGWGGGRPRLAEEQAEDNICPGTVEAGDCSLVLALSGTPFSKVPPSLPGGPWHCPACPFSSGVFGGVTVSAWPPLPLPCSFPCLTSRLQGPWGGPRPLAPGSPSPGGCSASLAPPFEPGLASQLRKMRLMSRFPQVSCFTFTGPGSLHKVLMQSSSSPPAGCLEPLRSACLVGRSSLPWPFGESSPLDVLRCVKSDGHFERRRMMNFLEMFL